MDIPSTTEWWVLKICLYMKPYRLQLLLALNDTDTKVWSSFCMDFVEMLANDETQVYAGV